MPEKLQTIVIFDIDGVIRDVSGSYRRAIADTVEEFTNRAWRPTMADIDNLKAEGIWNNDWQASQELTYRYYESVGKSREEINLDYEKIVDFFQVRYRGKNAAQLDGYITSEPLLVDLAYFADLTANNIGWGFFSGATRASAEYILNFRLGLNQPVLIAMEDAPGKPNPQGLRQAISQILTTSDNLMPVFYVGDTVADMQTINKAKQVEPERNWLAIGVLPPHVQFNSQTKLDYSEKLQQAGASIVVDNVKAVNPDLIEQLMEIAN
ncbi:MAG: TIGR01548 family HAD-type hydrolase [Cyanobacteria bacterium J083]|nr:MAG: TIGR01548 family HAD-type hydrolase [Cyanobacteria bacterium J083]